MVTGKVQYKSNGKWIDVKFDSDSQTTTPSGTLVLTYEPSAYLDNPMYYYHFTISRLENGVARLMNFDEGQSDMGNGTSWANTFKDGCKLDEGTYILITGSRMASGNVMASARIFNVEEGQTTTIPLDMRHSTTEVNVIGSFNSESLILKDNKEVSVLSQTGRG